VRPLRPDAAQLLAAPFSPPRFPPSSRKENIRMLDVNRLPVDGEGGLLELLRTLTDPRKPATINIHKVDDAGNVLAGATFTLFNSSGATSFSCTTVSNGNCTISNILPVGTYTVRETTTPVGYLTAADQTVTLTLNQIVTLTFTDILAKPQLLLVKVVNLILALSQSPSFLLSSLKNYLLT